MSKQTPELTMRIAPKQTCEYWQVKDWQDAHNSNNWTDMYQIFKDRIENRFINAIQGLIDVDDCQPTRRFGFSIMALDCLLIETLAQFYQGLKTSDQAQCEKGHKLSNTEFYVNFLTSTSLKLKDIFTTDELARTFYRTIRCGILHQGETTGGSKIVTTGSDIIMETKNPDGLIINRTLFHDFLVKNEYKTYCDCLKANSPEQLRKNMIKKMAYICQIALEE